MNIFLDIETLPAEPKHEPVLRELFARRPGRATSFDQYVRGTSLSGNWGRIFCVGLSVDDAPVTVLRGDEPTLLGQFWTQVEKADLFIGHNVMDFDLPFIYKRSTVHNVRPSRELSFARYRRDQIYDTMREWDNWANFNTGLDQLAKILDLESSKQGIDGAQVYDYYLAGKYQEIYDYCAADVELTRKIYKRLVFEE